MSEEKIISRAQKVVLVIAVIYTVLTILATISAIGDIENISSTSVGIGTVFSLVWFQLLVIASLIFTYFMYKKRGRTAILLELIIRICVIYKCNN